MINSQQDKLELIKVIDNLNMQKELLELRSQGIEATNIQKAAKHLGKKSQSAVKKDKD